MVDAFFTLAGQILTRTALFKSLHDKKNVTWHRFCHIIFSIAYLLAPVSILLKYIRIQGKADHIYSVEAYKHGIEGCVHQKNVYMQYMTKTVFKLFNL